MERQVETLLKGRQFKQLLGACIDSLKKEYGLRSVEIEALYYLSCCGENNAAKDIAASLCINKGHLSAAMESLCRRGYVSAEKDTADYRLVRYRITDAAQQVTSEINTAVGRLYSALFAGITSEDQETLRRVAAQMTENIGRLLQQKTNKGDD